MIIRANNSATRRTKTRVKMITLDAKIRTEKSSVPALGGKAGVLIDSKGWIGWLPTHQITIDEPVYDTREMWC